jgi:hypothetical protein
MAWPPTRPASSPCSISSVSAASWSCPDRSTSARAQTGPQALGIDLLLALFGVQHSVMARRSFKRW